MARQNNRNDGNGRGGDDGSADREPPPRTGVARGVGRVVAHNARNLRDQAARRLRGERG